MPSTYQDRIDGLSTSVAVKAPVLVSTTTNITLSGLQTVNSVVLAADDRVLVKDQTDASENGIYDVSTSTWERTKDFDGNRDVVRGTLIWDLTGAIFYQISTSDPITIGTSGINFSVASSLSVTGTTEVSTKAAMSALTASTLAENQLILMTSRSSPGDEGHGVFRVTKSDISTEVTADTEEGVYVPFDSDGTGASGGLIRNYTGRENVKWFGSAGDGVTDDSTAILAAKAFSNNLFWPAGTYIVTQDIISTSETKFAWTADESVTIKRTSNGTVLRFASCTDFSISGFILIGNKVFGSAFGCITLDGCTNWKINDNICESSGRQGINITNTCSEGIISGNIISDCYQDGIMIRNDSRRITVSDNICFANGDSTPIGEGIHIFDAQTITLTGNVCYNNFDHGLVFEGADYCTASGNLLISNGQAGFSGNSSTNAGTGSIIHNNIIRNNTTDGIILADVDDNIFDGNTIVGNGTYGIRCSIGSGVVADRNSFNNNNLSGNTSGAILVDWDSNETIITNNMLRGTGGTGILINRAACDNTYIAGNNVKSFTTAQITDNGTNTIMIDNTIGNPLNARVTFATAATVAVVFPVAMPNAGFVVNIDPAANETFWVTTKSTTGFTINSSNGTSTAQVDWSIDKM